MQVVVAHNVCNSRPKGSRTQLQQITRYCQDKNIKLSPKELPRKDFTKQCGEWRREKERSVIVMDANKHIIDDPLRKMFEAEGVELEEFSHKYWGNKPPNTYIGGTIPIDDGYKIPGIEVTAFCILGFMESPGGHRS